MNTSKTRTLSTRNGLGSTRTLTILALEHGIPAPTPPSGTDFDAAERKTWRALWKGPQGAIWDESYTPAVAAYVLLSHKLYRGEGTAWVASEQRALGDSLGLSPKGLTALGYILEGAP